MFYMNAKEIIQRLRIGFAIVIGFLFGKFLATTMGHHASEFFIGGFGLGVVVIQGIYWLFDTFFKKKE